MAIIVFVLLVLSGFWWISNYFSGEGINELVIFHLMTDLSGAGLSEFKYHFIFSGAYFFAILFASIQSYRFVQAKTSIAQNKLPSLLALALLTFSVIIHPALADISRILEQKIALANNQASDTGQAFEIDEREISNKKNIVYIYLESVEATYLDAERFPNLMPNISQYVKNSVSFSDIRQT
jgi:phosphoglycerol transferase